MPDTSSGRWQRTGIFLHGRGAPLSTRWGIEPNILCAGNDAAIAFAQDVLSEVMELFPSQFIHIGGDEAPKERWKQCAKCQARIKTEGLKDEHEPKATSSAHGQVHRRPRAPLDRVGRDS